MSLKTLDYLTRSQLQVLHDLGSVRNASRVLKQMDNYISSFRDGENVYYLNSAGRERVGCKKVRKKTLQARHYIMRNSLYIGYGCPQTWKNEQSFEVPKQVKVICDAYFVEDDQFHIVEVDHMQKMSVNRTKINKYRKLINLGVFDKPPVFIWITTTDYRRKQLEHLCIGLDVQIFTVSDFH